MKFEKNLEIKANELINKANELQKIKIKWEKSICLKCSDLRDKKNTYISDDLLQNKKSPAIYFFKITSNHNEALIIKTLNRYKIKNERNCPKINKKRAFISEFLYCGSIKEGLHNRFYQHLGFGNKRTYSLQLFFWAKKLKLELEFHYAWLNYNQIEITELVESALSNKIKPIVGKLA